MSLLNDFSQSWQKLVVICAGTAWGEGWPSEKHIATQLSKFYPILYVEPARPLNLRSGNRHYGLGAVTIVDPRIAVLSPVAPPASSQLGMRSIMAAMTNRIIASTICSLRVDRPKAIVIARHIDHFDAVDPNCRIMYATDDFVAGADLMGLPRGYLKKNQLRQAASADRIVVVSEHLGRLWRSLGHEPVLIPNGCDIKRFEAVDEAQWPDDVRLPRPIAGVFGHLSHRIDLSLLEAVADRGHSLLLVGSVQASFPMSKLLTRRNVHYLGPRPFSQMPGYLRAIDVGLTPYVDNEFNRASFPLKTLEYLEHRTVKRTYSRQP